MLNNILTAINLGRQLLQARADFKRAMPDEPAPVDDLTPQLAQIDVLSEKINDLELLTQKQGYRIRELEHDLKEITARADAIAHKAEMTLWLAVAGLTLAVLAVAFAVLQWHH